MLGDDIVTSLWFPESVASAQSGGSCLGQSWGRGLVWFLSYLLSILSDPLKKNAYMHVYCLLCKALCSHSEGGLASSEPLSYLH